MIPWGVRLGKILSTLVSVYKQQFSDEAPKSEVMCDNKFTSNTINIKSDPRSKAWNVKEKAHAYRNFTISSEGLQI